MVDPNLSRRNFFLYLFTGNIFLKFFSWSIKDLFTGNTFLTFFSWSMKDLFTGNIFHMANKALLQVKLFAFFIIKNLFFARDQQTTPSKATKKHGEIDSFCLLEI